MGGWDGTGEFSTQVKTKGKQKPPNRVAFFFNEE